MNVNFISLVTAGWLFSLILVASLPAIEKPESVKVDGKIDWVYDYAEGQRLAKESDKPMFVVFRCER